MTLEAPNEILLSGITIESVSHTGSLNLVLNSSGSGGPVVVQNNSSISLNGGSFTAFGTGNSSITTGVDILSSTINTEGGSISLTGQASFVFNSGLGGDVAGTGVIVNDSILENASSTETAITSGDITIMGNGSPGSGITSVTNLKGAYITFSVMSVVNGAISITGDVNSGTASATASSDNNSGRSIGVLVDDGTVIHSTGSGSITFAGDTISSTAAIASVGVDISGINPSTGAIDNTFVVAAGGSGISITGAAGATDNSPSGTNVQTPSTSGVVIESGATLTASNAAPLMLTGTGGDRHEHQHRGADE